jgi:hypothetical protein
MVQVHYGEGVANHTAPGEQADQLGISRNYYFTRVAPAGELKMRLSKHFGITSRLPVTRPQPEKLGVASRTASGGLLFCNDAS